MKYLNRLLRKIESHRRLFVSGYHINNLYRSIPEALCFSDVKKHVLDYRQVSEPSTVRYDFPDKYPGFFRNDAVFPARYAYHLCDVYVNTLNGACGTNSVAFQESYGSLRFWLRNSPLNSHLFRNESETVSHGTLIAPASYYHFMLEHLPRLIHTITAYNITNVYYYQDISKYIYDILLFLADIYSLNLISTNKRVLRFDNYYFTQAYDKSGFAPIEDIDLIKNLFSNNHLTDQADSSEMIYISRRNSLRSLSNEASLESTLKARGFRILLTEDITIHDKCDLFRNAHTVVAAHGGGLANMLWVNPGTRIVEIQSNIHNDCYARLALSLGLNYEYIQSEYDGSDDWNIDINKLQKLL